MLVEKVTCVVTPEGPGTCTMSALLRNSARDVPTASTLTAFVREFCACASGVNVWTAATARAATRAAICRQTGMWFMVGVGLMSVRSWDQRGDHRADICANTTPASSINDQILRAVRWHVSSPPAQAALLDVDARERVTRS